MRLAKVRITDHRPTAGKPSPVGRRTAATTGGSMTGLDYLTASQARDAAAHDKAIRDYDEETLLTAATDLGKRRVFDRKDPEHRWVMNRRAALLRELDRKGALV